MIQSASTQLQNIEAESSLAFEENQNLEVFDPNKVQAICSEQLDLRKKQGEKFMTCFTDMTKKQIEIFGNRCADIIKPYNGAAAFINKVKVRKLYHIYLSIYNITNKPNNITSISFLLLLLWLHLPAKISLDITKNKTPTKITANRPSCLKRKRTCPNR